MSLQAASPTAGADQVIDRFYGALAAGDVEAACACCTADAVFWHSFDRVEMSLDEIVPSWRALVAGFAARAFTDVRRAPIPGGFVQRQLMVGRTAGGARIAWPVCFFVTLRDGLIARLDEYLDRAGSFQVDADDAATPGLPPPDADPLVN
jgi:hypothetical protein